jgi:hypothetical protein
MWITEMRRCTSVANRFSINYGSWGKVLGKVTSQSSKQQLSYSVLLYRVEKNVEQLRQTFFNTVIHIPVCYIKSPKK